MKSQVKIELRPNNQITLTHGSWRKPENIAYKSAHLVQDEVSLERDGLRKIPKMAEKYQDRRDDYESKKDLYAWRLNQAKSAPISPLDIILKSQRPRKKPLYTGNKPKSFTRQSGQKLRECGAAIDIVSEGNLAACREVTLTLPANHFEAFKVIADYSGYAVNRLFQPIRRKYGSDCHWFFVWEYQKRGALHMHICVYHADVNICKEIAEKLISQWFEVLCDISEKTGICLFSNRSKRSCVIRQNHQNHTAPIQKAVGAYFSKYAGKEESKNNWYCREYPVSRFWGCCMALKKIIKAHSLKFELDLFNEKESEKKFESIIENILEKLDIVSATSYDFDIQLKGKARLNRCKDGKKYLSKDRDISIASGTRYTFYINPQCFKSAMDMISSEMVCF